MTKTILLHTLGNRDLQFHKSIDYQFVTDFLDENSENRDFLVISKKRSSIDETFVLKTERILTRVQAINQDFPISLYEKMTFPMLDTIIAYVMKQQEVIDELWLLVTAQNPLFATDTIHVGAIAELYIKYQQKYARPRRFNTLKKVVIKYIEPSPKEQPKEIQNHCYKLFKEIDKNFNQVFISHKGGHPQITDALYIAGSFTDYKYLVSNKINGIQMTTEEDLTARNNVLIEQAAKYFIQQKFKKNE